MCALFKCTSSLSMPTHLGDMAETIMKAVEATNNLTKTTKAVCSKRILKMVNGEVRLCSANETTCTSE